MGAAAPGPFTPKASGCGAAPEKGLTWGWSGMKGWRPTMEDRHLATPELGGNGWESTAAFGVLDGHGGQMVASFCEDNLLPEVSRGDPEDVIESLTNAFHRMDELLLGVALTSAIQRTNWKSIQEDPHWVGCTAVVCCVRRHEIICANAGDSRAVLCRSGKAVPMSEDHKPMNPVERERIRNAGGTVVKGPSGVYRVNGNLNLSRAIGDLQYKRNSELSPAEQIICSTPDVHVEPRQSLRDEFLVLACDGVWDVMDSQEVVDFIRERLIEDPTTWAPDAGGDQGVDESRKLSRICEALLDRCLSPDLCETSGLGGDNMTAVLVLLRPVLLEVEERRWDKEKMGCW